MCGIAGVVAWNERWRVGPQVLAEMSRRVAHRGPDQAGDWTTHADRPFFAALAFRRLAVLDPDPRANQPMVSRDGRLALVFNGEIYNFRELRGELDEPWRTTGDAEVLLEAWRRLGEDGLERLNGMFAGAAVDLVEQRVHLFRDRMGQKPLYYALTPDRLGLAFASELRALTTVPWVDTTVSQDSIGEYLTFGYVPCPATIYREVSKLPPATCLTVDRGRTRTRCYFDPNAPSPGPRSPERARALLEAAVRRQLVSDVPLGCFLSGGVDSSIVALCMRRAAPPDQPVLTFSVGFADRRYDESAWAAAVARHLGTHHVELRATPDVVAGIHRLAEAFGEPFADSSALAVSELSRLARGHVTVALSGDGGDELFGGYDRYRAMAIMARLDLLPVSLRRALARLARILPGDTHPKSAAARLRRLLESAGRSPARRYLGYVSLFDRGSARFEQEMSRLLAVRDPVAAAAAIDRLTYLPDDLLTKVDRAGMLHALEIRSPFMDHEVVRFAAGLDAAGLIGGGPKRLLRLAFAKDLPAWMFTRRKMGFALPIGAWLRNELWEMVVGHLLARNAFSRQCVPEVDPAALIGDHLSGRRDHSQRLYALLMLELWAGLGR